MEMKHDKSYLYLYKRMVDTGFTDEVVGKICVQGGVNEQENITELLDILENNFRMYQYKKDNGVKYGTEDLFYWGDRERYFDVTVKANDLKNHNKIVADVLNIIENNFKNSDFYVRLQYDNRIDYEKINEYLKQDFDISNFQISTLGAFYENIPSNHGRYTKESTQKLYKLSNDFLDQYVDKKVIVNQTLKGTIHKLDDIFALFKPRATKTYYPLNIGVIQSIELV